MKSAWKFLTGALFGFAFAYIAYQYHFVMSDDGLIVVSKPQATLADVYADIRGWSLDDWTTHTELARALVADGRGELVGGSLMGGALDKLLPPSPGSGEDPQSATTVLDTLSR